VAELAFRILDEQDEPDRAWAELASANLLGLCLPEDVGGSGYGFVEACVLLHELGRTTSPVPLLPTLLTAMAIAEFGTQEQRKRWLPGVAAGDVVLSAEIDGLVPFGDRAAAVLRTGNGGVEVLRGATFTRHTTTTGDAVFTVDTPGDAEPLGGADAERWLLDRWTVAVCAVQAGVSDRALRMTAEYTSGRQQFDRVIASFQAVGQRLADAYIDAEAIALTMWQAAWRLAEGMPAADEIAIAKYWASDGGQRVAAATQHLHGGMGVALDYPLHRYTLWAKQNELTLGAASKQLDVLAGLL
jgi:3-oxocholest-4-en-26-oyl-CoA dehydrogenase beta subunit